MKRKKYILTVVLILIVVVLLVPSGLERCLINLKTFSNHYSGEVWFGFIASYLGAIGTVVLGIIALYQNKLYKDLSDKSEKKLFKLQKDSNKLTTDVKLLIKENKDLTKTIGKLTEKNVELIELNTKILRAKYTPVLNLDYTVTYFNTISSKECNENGSVQFTYGDYVTPDKQYPNISIENLSKEYYLFGFKMENDGESEIRNFICSSVIINDKGPEEMLENYTFTNCNISPGKTVLCIFAMLYDLEKECMDGTIDSVIFNYIMQNALAEDFSMSITIDFTVLDEGVFPNFKRSGIQAVKIIS